MVRVRLDDLRKKRKWSKYELAKRLGYPYKSINRILRDDYNPPIKTLAEHADKLGVSVKTLIEHIRPSKASTHSKQKP